MSKTKKGYHKLGSLQKRIILHLAKEGPRTINETKEKISRDYKPTWVAFNSLTKKGLIRKVSVKPYRGREYPLFWLTFEGQITALLNNANIKEVKQRALALSNDEDVRIWYEIAESLGPETARKLLKTVKEGKIDLAYFPIDKAEIEKFFRIIMKYPKYRKVVKDMFGKLNVLMKGS